MKTINLSEFYPIMDIQGNVIFANNGNLVQCYSVGYPEIYSLSEKDFEEIHGSWFQAFKALPVGTIVHKQDVYRKAGYSAENLPNESFLQQATYHYFKGREYLDHSSFLFFVLPLKKTFNTTKYVNPFRKVEKGIHRQMDHCAREFVNAVNDAVSFINNSRKITLAPMCEDSILESTNNYFNG